MSDIKKNKDKGFTKAEKSWILYDWANSVYATNIMAAIFPTILFNWNFRGYVVGLRH